MITLTEKRTFKKTEVHDILFSIFEHYGDLVLNGMRILTDSTGLWYTDLIINLVFMTVKLVKK